VIGGDVVVLALGLHNLSGSARRLAKFLPPLSNPCHFDSRPIGVRQFLLGVPINVQCYCQHVAVDGVVSNTFARITLNSSFEWTTTLVGACETSLRGIRWGTGRSESKTTGTNAIGTVAVGHALWATVTVGLFKTKHPWTVSLQVAESLFVLV
jgi:hypothetical protein